MSFRNKKKTHFKSLSCRVIDEYADQRVNLYVILILYNNEQELLFLDITLTAPFSFNVFKNNNNNNNNSFLGP